MKPKLIFFHALACALVMSGCSTGSSPGARSGESAAQAMNSAQGGVTVPAVEGPPPNAGATPMATYLIGPGDQLQVDVFRVPDMATTGRVSELGTFVMPLIGPVAVGGLTSEQAGRKIATALAQDYLQDPQVNVQVLESANMNFTVGGAVKKPGVFPVRGKTTLMQAISLAEGVTEMAKPEEVMVFRTLPGQPMKAYVVDLKKVQRGELADPVLAVNDKVVVPESGSAVWLKNVSGTLRGLVTFNPLFY